MNRHATVSWIVSCLFYEENSAHLQPIQFDCESFLLGINNGIGDDAATRTHSGQPRGSSASFQYIIVAVSADVTLSA